MKKFSLFFVLLCATMISFAASSSEYCCYYGNETKDGDAYVTLSWITDASGNVVITIGEGPGATSSAFRNGGFEGGIDAFVVSTDNFATTTPASDYFTATQVYSGNVYTLTKIAELPAGAQIKHVGAGHALAWKVNGKDAYSFPDFIYTYGGVCDQWPAPTNVAVSADSVITFTEVTGAEQYTAFVALNGAVKHEQIVVSGDKLNFKPLASGTYKVTVVAFGNGKLESDPSEEVDWALTAEEVVLGNSEYCDHTVLEGDNREAKFTWITNAEGAVVITITEVEGGEAADFHFRGNGMAIGSFNVGTTPASSYFNHACSGNTVTLSLKDAANAPAKGEKITYNAVVEYATTLDGNAWPTIAFEYTYGTECENPATLIPVVTDPTVVKKMIEDGRLVIEHNGVRYNVLGTRLQ